VSREFLQLWHRNSSGTQRKGNSLLEAGTRGVVKRQQTENTQCMCSELQTVRTSNSIDSQL
jgi:hypothetical protein